MILLCNSAMMVHTCKLEIGRPPVPTSLGYIVSSGSAWASYMRPCFKRQQKILRYELWQTTALQFWSILPIKFPKLSAVSALPPISTICIHGGSFLFFWFCFFFLFFLFIFLSFYTWPCCITQDDLEFATPFLTHITLCHHTLLYRLDNTTWYDI